MLSKDLLHHLPDPMVLWEEIKRLGRPGAAVYVMDLVRPATTEAAPTEEKKEAFGIIQVWTEGGIVAQVTLIIMVLMFAGTIYIAATKAVDQTFLLGQIRRIPAFWDANTLDEGLDVLGRSNAFRAIAEGAIAQANSAQAGLGARISRSDRMSHQVGIELERLNARLNAGMAFLATV